MRERKGLKEEERHKDSKRRQRWEKRGGDK